MIKNILKGWYYSLTKKNMSLKDKRIKICETCEHKKELTKNISICDLCGCFLDSKVRVEDEECLMHKW